MDSALPASAAIIPRMSRKMPQSVPVQDQVGVVRHIAAGSSQVNDACSLRRSYAVGIDMGHYIVTHFFFPPRRQLKIDVLHMGFQRRHLFRRDGQSQFMLDARQLRPEPAPGLDAGPLGEQAFDLL